MKLLLFLPWVFTVTLSPSWAVKSVLRETRQVGKAKVEFEVVDGYPRPIRFKLEGKDYEILDPHFVPYVATDGKAFYQLGYEFSPKATWAISAQGELAASGDTVSAFSAQEPPPELRAQVYTYLSALPRSKRPGDPQAVETFLVDSARELHKVVLRSKGIDKGATLFSHGERYKIAGSYRYPGLVIKNNNVFYAPRDGTPVRALIFDEEKLKVQTADKKGFVDADPKTVVPAYHLLLMDSWKDIGGKDLALPFLEANLPGKGKTLPLVASQIYPHRYQQEFITDEKGKVLSREEVEARALNFALNFIGSNEKAAPAKTKKKATHTEVDVSKFLSPVQLARLARANPYSCKPTEVFPLRLDWMIAQLAKDDLYRELSSIPDGIYDLAVDKEVTRSIKPLSERNINVVTTSSGVAQSERVLNWQRGLYGLSFYQTFDKSVGLDGKPIDKSTVMNQPSKFKHDAGEYIFFKKNHFQGYGLYLASGDVSPVASDSLISDAVTGFGPFIHNPVSCSSCHSGGLRSPIDQTPENLSDWMLTEEKFEEMNKSEKKYKNYQEYVDEVKKYFADAEKYMKVATQDNINYRKALVDSKSFVSLSGQSEILPILADFTKAYNDKVTISQAAKELGVPQKSLNDFLSRAGQVRIDDGNVVFDMAEGNISRADFERAFCALRDELGKRAIEAEEDLITKTRKGTSH